MSQQNAILSRPKDRAKESIRCVVPYNCPGIALVCFTCARDQTGSCIRHGLDAPIQRPHGHSEDQFQEDDEREECGVPGCREQTEFIRESFVTALEQPKFKNKHIPVNCIVLPSTALLNANTTPFRFGQETRFGECLGQFLGKNDMSKKSTEKNNR